MAETTHISWADSTLNVWMGCTKVSNGPQGACEGCYAQVLVEDRFGRAAWGPHAERVETKGWRAQLRKISRLALAAGRPWFVFVNSLSDFWDNQADPALRAAALAAFEEHPHLTFLLLTKRPQNIYRLHAQAASPPLTPSVRSWPRNAAIGFTAVTQAEMDRDAKHALAAYHALGAAFLFWSGEPLMEHIVLPPELLALGGRFWAITGGETDQGSHKARETPDGAFESLMAQCAAAGVPFHLKQMTKKRPIPAHLQIQERPNVA